MTRPWLADYSWEMVVEINRLLCVPKNAAHGPTSDGHQTTRELWESQHLRSMSLAEAADLCRRCHRLAPFLNFNGNTFVAIIRQVISSLDLQSDQSAVLRSIAGHIVAGTSTVEEEAEFARALQQIQRPS